MRIVKTTLLFGVIFLFALVSCQKAVEQMEEEEEPIEEPAEEIISRLPKLIIYKEPADNYSEVWSIKYDTVNRRIAIYHEDTTNAVPFDRIKEVYKYNKDGYLIEHFDYLDGQDYESTYITRHANNQIMEVSRYPGDVSTSDTFYYSYQQNGNDLKVKVRLRNNAGTPQDYPNRERDYTFNSSFQLTSIYYQPIDASILFSYTQGKLNRLYGSGPEWEYEELITYATGTQPYKVDSLKQFLLGRDYYIVAIQDLYFLPLFMSQGNFMLSATDPNLPSRLVTTTRNPIEGELTEAREYAFEMNSKGVPVKMTATYEGETSIIEFRY